MLVEAGLIAENRVFEISFEDFERLESYYHLSNQIKEIKRENKSSSLGENKRKKGGLNIRPNGKNATVTRSEP